MKVILLKDVPGLGRIGDIKECKEGFAKNHLFPNGLAKQATEHALLELSQQQRTNNTKKEKENLASQEILRKLYHTKLVFELRASKEHTFGSVSKNDIIQKLQEQGTTIQKESLFLEKAIKKTGEFEIPVSLKNGLRGVLKIVVQTNSQN